MEKRIFIHIGHGKTGSSAIQSALAANRDLLGRHGVQYPFHSSFKRAAGGGISSGNGALLIKGMDSIKFEEDIILSGETMFVQWKTTDRRIFLEKAHSLGYGVSFVCYTRDFFEHSFSAWGQKIKRGGGVSNYEDFMDREYQTFHFLLHWLRAAESEGLDLRVFNYDRFKENLIDHFFRQALRRSDLAENIEYENNSRINRSLTMAEYELQRQFNLAYKGRSHTFVSDALVEGCPNIRSEVPVVSKESHTRITARYSDKVAEINRYLDDKNKIVFTPYEELYADITDVENNKFCFSYEQLEVLAKSLSTQLAAVNKDD